MMTDEQLLALTEGEGFGIKAISTDPFDKSIRGIYIQGLSHTEGETIDWVDEKGEHHKAEHLELVGRDPLPIIHKDFSFTAADLKDVKLTDEQIRERLARGATLRMSREEDDEEETTTTPEPVRTFETVPSTFETSEEEERRLTGHEGTTTTAEATDSWLYGPHCDEGPGVVLLACQAAERAKIANGLCYIHRYCDGASVRIVDAILSNPNGYWALFYKDENGQHHPPSGNPLLSLDGVWDGIDTLARQQSEIPKDYVLKQLRTVPAIGEACNLTYMPADGTAGEIEVSFLWVDEEGTYFDPVSCETLPLQQNLPRERHPIRETLKRVDRAFEAVIKARRELGQGVCDYDQSALTVSDVPSECLRSREENVSRYEPMRFSTFMIATLGWLVLLALIVYSLASCSLAHGADPKIYGEQGRHYRVEKPFLVVMKATAIDDAARAIRNGDNSKLETMIEEKKVGGVPKGAKVILRSRGTHGSTWFADVHHKGAAWGKCYVFDAFLDPDVKFVKE